jgi:16S rRNA (cytosine1402-N4)-methyltransferase
MDIYHTSVLLQETLDYLKITPGGKYIDATLGGGGHTERILEAGGIVLGLDVDQEAIAYVESKFKVQSSKFKINNNLTLVRGNFKDIDGIARSNGFEKINGILFDLGVSSHQLDAVDRGFSYKKNCKLDMRMDRNLGVTAKDLLKVLPKGELYALFTKFGEERNSFRIAANIVESRRIESVETTVQLVKIIQRSIPYTSNKDDSAARIFQALRIAVNDELNNLSEGLSKTLTLLDSMGRVVVISFHSLEDRIVKQTFQNWAKQNKGIIITDKPVVPDRYEIEHNQRSRSAKLRVFEKK